MNVKETNEALLSPHARLRTVLPRLAQLATQRHVFRINLGLEELPDEPGFIAVRGARQYGKSTWLEENLAATVKKHGPGSALYLNGDEIAQPQQLRQLIRELVPLFAARAPVRRLFIDEITAVKDWQRELKAAFDSGELRGVLVVTTGSRATDLRRGTERLPGRKGKLERSSYLFPPVSYREFRRVCGKRLGRDTLTAYSLSGGSPVALNELAEGGRLPDYVIEMVRDWILGEFAVSGRERSSVLAVMEQLHRLGGSPIGQAKLAREAGLANNTVAAGYVELLADLMCVGICRSWDASHRTRIRRRPAKYPFTNLLAAVAWDPSRVRSIAEFQSLPAERLGTWLEWLTAQELWRRAAIDGDEAPEELTFWNASGHELDYVLGDNQYLEVKHGKSGPLDFAWFGPRFREARLTVITSTPFETERIRGIDIETFLLEDW